MKTDYPKRSFFNRFLGLLLILCLGGPNPAWGLRAGIEGKTKTDIEQELQAGLEGAFQPAVKVYQDEKGRRRIRWNSIPPELQPVLRHLKKPEFHGNLFVIGGFTVRVLLGQPPHDLDLVIAQGVPFDHKTVKDRLGLTPHVDPGGLLRIDQYLEGMKVDMVPSFVNSASGKPIPELPEFSFNRILMGFDQKEDPYLLDPYDGYQDLFPSKGPRRGRLAGELGYLVGNPIYLAKSGFMARFLRFAQDGELALDFDEGTIDIMSLVVFQLKQITQAHSTGLSVQDRETLIRLASEFDQWHISRFTAAGLEQKQPLPLAEFADRYTALMREPANRELRETVEALWERDVGVWVVPGTFKPPAAEAVSQKIMILVHAADDQRSEWESAVQGVIEEFPLKNVTFKIMPYPADGAVGEPGVPVVVIQQVGTNLAAPSRPIPVISFETPQQARVLTSAMLYSIAINKAIGSVIAIVRFTDGMGKDQLAVFV